MQAPRTQTPLASKPCYLQCAWLILMFCAAARANYFLRVVHPGSSEEHGAAIWQVFLQLSNITGGHETRDLASLPQARRIGTPQCGSRSPSSLLVQLGLSQRFGSVILRLQMQSCWPSFGAEAACTSKRGEHLQGVGFDAPEWGDLVCGVRPGYDPLVDDWPRLSTQGWQHFASEAVEASFLADTIWPRLDVPHQALMRSQQGPMAGIPFTRRVAPQAPLATPPLVIVLPMWPSTCLVATIAQLVRWRPGFAERQADE